MNHDSECEGEGACPGALVVDEHNMSATRSALAAMVNDGLVPPLEGKNELSTIYRLSRLCARLLASTTLSPGLSPARQVPHTWAIRSVFSACFKS